MALKLTTGTFESTLDDKGRVVIPSSLREHYPGELVITKGSGFCACIMTSKNYEIFLRNFKEKVSSLNSDLYEAFEHQYVTPAQEVEIDQKTGRIPVPATIRTYARLSKDCLILSFFGRLEIWSAEAYRACEQEIQQKAREAMQKLGPVHFFPKEGI